MLTAIQAADILVSPEQIATMTGYKQPSRQVAELRRQGFVRARLNREGVAVLERAHYDAVCRGDSKGSDAPQLRFA